MTDRDTIILAGLRVDAGIGVYPHERTHKQTLVIDVRVKTSIRAAAEKDDLQKSVDYDGLAETCRQVAQEKHHALIETVAEKIARRVLRTPAGLVGSVFVRVAKPGAVPDAALVAVEITRSLDDD